MLGLKNKRVFITGAASGIGKATAERFYLEGSELILIDRQSILECGLLSIFPDRMTYIQGDITNIETIEKIKTQAAFGMDVFINNAGITKDATIFKMTDEQWDEVIAVNLTTVFKLSKLAAQVMKSQGRGGVILNAASIVAHYGNFGQANYCASKAGVIALSKTLAKELGKDQIRVNVVAPGSISTKMLSHVPEKIQAMIADKTSLKRIGSPQDVASAYAFLASDDASYITGTTLNVDGGLILG